MANARIAVVGGGTGSHSVLSGLKRFPVDLTAIVAMSPTRPAKASDKTTPRRSNCAGSMCASLSRCR